MGYKVRLIAKYLLPLPVLPLITAILLLCCLQASTSSMHDASYLTTMRRCSRSMQTLVLDKRFESRNAAALRKCHRC